MSLVAHHKPAIVEQPANGAFDYPAPFVSSKRTAVLRRRSDSSPAMRADQFDASLGQTRAQGIAVGSAVVDRRLGRRRRMRCFKSGSINWTSAGLALAMSTPSGVPRPSTRSMIFVPLPRLVLPTQAPLFGRGERAVGHRLVPAERLQPVESVQEPCPRLLEKSRFGPLLESAPASGRRRKVCW